MATIQTSVYALLLISIIVSSENIEINKQKQEKLLRFYLTSEQDDLSISDSSKQLILGLQQEDTTTSTLLKIRGIGVLQKQELFSQFDNQHMQEVDKIFDLLYAASTYDEFIQRATLLKAATNRNLLLNAVQKALLYRQDTNDVQAPPMWQISARSFFTSEAITAAIQNARSRSTLAYDVPISRAVTSTDPESQLAWFREDIGKNSMHYLMATMVRSKDDNVESQAVKRFSLVGYNPDRARYHAERKTANMEAIQPIHIEENIKEGYDSHLSTPLGDAMFAPRPSGMKPQDVRRACNKHYTISELKYINEKATDAIQTGYMITNDGQKTPTTPVNLFRTSFGFYDKVQLDHVYGHGSHMYIHQLLASITDPEGKSSQKLGVLGVIETSMRDPLFYRIHYPPNEVEAFYANLQPYSKSELAFPGVEITDVKFMNTDREDGTDNVLTTYMETTTVDVQYDPTIAAQIDGAPTPIMIGVEQLNHDSFKYMISVSNSKPVSVSASVRTFLAPSIDQNTGKPFESLYQRLTYSLLDRFVIKLQPGNNIIERQDVDSTISSPSLLSVEELMTPGMMKDENAGCMWPENLLLPRGNAKGAEFDVFVIITEWEEPSKISAKTGVNPCGIMDDTDTKMPNYPFEREMSQGVAEYLINEAKNTFLFNINIVHQDKR